MSFVTKDSEGYSQVNLNFQEIFSAVWKYNAVFVKKNCTKIGRNYKYVD